MSEVKRYRVLLVIDDNPLNSNWTEVVRASDFDALRLRADTAEAELKALKHPMNSAQQLRKDLAAAELRIAKLNGLLREGIDSFEELLTSRDTREVLVDLGAWGINASAALNPNPEAESHE